MSNWWHTLASIGMAVLVTVTPTIQGAIGHHPILGVVLGTMWAILGHVLPSPLVQPGQ
jgi:hypothetical protein